MQVGRLLDLGLRPCRPRPRSARPSVTWTPPRATPPPRGGGTAPDRPRRPRRRRPGSAPRRTTHRARRARRRLVAGDQRDQLATTRQQPVEHVGGHVEQVVADDARSRPRPAPRTSPGEQGPALVIASLGGDRDRTVPRVACGGGHRHHVGLDRAARLVHRQRGDALHLGAGRHHDHLDPRPGRSLRPPPRPPPRSRGRWAARSPPGRRWPRSRPGSRRSRAGGPGRRRSRWRRPRRTAPPGPARPRPRPPPAPVGLRPGPRVRSSCSAKWVTWIRRGRPASMPASTARADVVDVHVDVPQPLAADDDQRVAERRRGSARSGGIASSSASRRYITS